MTRITDSRYGRIARDMASHLNQRITLLGATDTPDGAGGVTRQWQSVAEVWAHVSPQSGGEQRRDGTIESGDNLQIIVRYRSNVTPGMRLEWRGETYDIEQVRDIDAARVMLALSARPLPAGA